MDVFEGVKFKGTFRSYQQKVLDHSAKYLADGKINVVAAPGSGKTILGLELIRRLGKPAVIFSRGQSKRHLLSDACPSHRLISAFWRILFSFLCRALSS